MLLTQDHLSNNIADKILLKQSEMLTAINYSMINLFWEIGGILNANLSQNGLPEESQISLKKISGNLSVKFSEYFSYEDLISMKQFNIKCPATVLVHISSYVSWEYIPIFFPLESDKAWVFYAKLIHEESLAPEQLKKRIAEKLFEKIGSTLIDINNPFIELLISRPPRIYRKVFHNEDLDKLQTLLEPQADKINLVREERSSETQKIILTLNSKVLDFQFRCNNHANIRFNFFLWDIGTEIIRLFDTFQFTNEQEMVNKLSIQMEEQFGSLFNLDQIRDCIRFAKRFAPDEQEKIIELAGAVQWEHIRALLIIDDRDTLFYYCHKTLKNGWNPIELKKFINNNYHQSHIPVQHKRESSNIQKTSKDLKSASGKQKILVTYTVIEELQSSEYDINRNIFKNPDLIFFIKSSLS